MTGILVRLPVIIIGGPNSIFFSDNHYHRQKLFLVIFSYCQLLLTLLIISGIHQQHEQINYKTHFFIDIVFLINKIYMKQRIE